MEGDPRSGGRRRCDDGERRRRRSDAGGARSDGGRRRRRRRGGGTTSCFLLRGKIGCEARLAQRATCEIWRRFEAGTMEAFLFVFFVVSRPIIVVVDSLCS